MEAKGPSNKVDDRIDSVTPDPKRPNFARLETQAYLHSRSDNDLKEASPVCAIGWANFRQTADLCPKSAGKMIQNALQNLEIR